MGAWFQNVGVGAASVPDRVKRLAASEGVWLPEQPVNGWSWLTLEGMLDDDDFDRLVESTAQEADVGAVGFGVFDEDSAYLVAAGPRGIACRLIFADEAFDAQFEGRGQTAAELSHGGPDAFAVWSESFAPAAVTASAVEELCASPYPPALLAAAGLYPEPPADDRPAWVDWYPEDMESAGSRDWDGGGHSQLVGTREFAFLPEPAGDFVGPPGTWIILLAHESLFSRSPIEPFLTFVAEDTVYGLGGYYQDADAARRQLGDVYYGRAVGEWNEVPEAVGRNMAVTIGWLVSEAAHVRS